MSVIVATVCDVSCGDSLIALYIMCLIQHITTKSQCDCVPRWLCYIAK